MWGLVHFEFYYFHIHVDDLFSYPMGGVELRCSWFKTSNSRASCIIVWNWNSVANCLVHFLLLQWLRSMAAIKNFFSRKEKKSKSGSERISEIGAPFGISHNVHVGFDNEARTFVGLPPAWQDWLKHSKIT